MTTAPRLFTFEPDVTVQRARWSVSSESTEACVAGVGVEAIGYLPVADVAAAAADDVVKCRSSRRRSSAPDFQIAYSSESARASADAAMMFVSLPIVDHSSVPSDESMITRVRAAVAWSPSRIRTL